MAVIDELFGLLVEHETKLSRSFSLIPSENSLSSLSRLAYWSDGISRYFFDEHEVFGRWSFQGGSIVGQIQREILVPLLRELGRARFVDLHAISGITGMTLILAAFGQPRTPILSVPVANGGHPDTAYIAGKLGLQPQEIPFRTWDSVDLERLADLVREKQPSLIYVDHATALFPLNLEEIVQVIRSASSGRRLHIHVDTSHVNGLVWGGELANPLDCGADTYGGSTHKTFPGPHKAVLFTNDEHCFQQLTDTAVNLISHHHTASMVALAIAVIEFVECNGKQYARRTLDNARNFASDLAEFGINVQGSHRGFTESHQVWIAPPDGWTSIHSAASALFDVGVIVNPYNPIPSLSGPGIRMGLNEPTSLGIDRSGLRALAGCVADCLMFRRPATEIARRVAEIRDQCEPPYCYGPEEVRRQWDRLATSAAGRLPGVLSRDRSHSNS